MTDPTDEEVEAAARAIDPNAFRDKSHGPVGKTEKLVRRQKARAQAKAALRAARAVVNQKE